MATDPTPPLAGSPQVNFIQPNGGITGLLLKVVQGGVVVAAMIAFFLMLYFFFDMFREQQHMFRQDMANLTKEFHDSIQRVNDEANRHTGEVKGSLDKNTDVIRQWIDESRASRLQLGQPPRPTMTLPKPIEP